MMAAGLLLMSISTILSFTVHLNDFVRGLMMGTGIVFILFSFIRQKQRSAR
jgi:hypothetical protein